MTPWVRRLIIANVLMYFVELTAADFARYLVLVPRFIFHPPYEIWTPFTYMFLHDPNGITHILFNMIGLYFFGPRVEERLGARRFLTLYFVSGLSGAAASFFFAYNNAVLGASGALFGVMLAFAKFWPDVQILFFFFLPLPAAVAIVIMVAMSLYAGITHAQTGVAEFCHLGGFAGAALYLWYLDRAAGVRKFRPKTVAAVPRETLSNWKRVDPNRVHEVNRDEVNRILDKISAKGLNSLTAQEKLFLSNFVPPDDRIPPPT